MPLVSVVIPCHNAEKTIERTVASVFAQIHTNWELILVNNNSADQTMAVLEEIKKNYAGIQSITVLDEKTKGGPAARNKGFLAAKGSYIQFLDADDVLLPNKIEHQLKILSNQPGASAVYASAQIIEDQKTYTREIIATDVWIAFFSSKMGITSANLFKTQDLQKINGWDLTKTSSQEYDLMFRMLRQGTLFLPDTEVLTQIYKLAESVSKSSDVEKQKQIITNRISLRVRAYHFLKHNNELTPERKNAFYRYKRNELQKLFDDFPWYVIYQINFTGSGLGFVSLAKQNFKFLKKILRQ